jgi:hypothetical protein
MLTFGSLGKWISYQGIGSQVPGVHVVKSFMSSTPGTAAAAAGGSAAVAAAAGVIAGSGENGRVSTIRGGTTIGFQEAGVS